MNSPRVPRPGRPCLRARLATDASRAIGIAALLVLFSSRDLRSHESPIDHVERTVLPAVRDGRLELRYRVELAERNALLQLRAMDADGDGRIAPEERRTFFAAEARSLAARLSLRLGDRPLELAPAGEVQCDPRLGQTYFFAAPLGPLTPGRWRVRLADRHARYAPGPYRLLQPPPTGPQTTRIELQDRPQLVDSERHPGLVAVDFEIVVPAAR